MVNVLGIQPIPVQKSLIDMAYSMIDMGIVPKTLQYKQVRQLRNKILVHSTSIAWRSYVNFIIHKLLF